MTAAFLIAEIFSRPQAVRDNNIRRLTERQFDCLRDLIHEEEAAQPGAVRPGERGGLVWVPGGRDRYVLTAEPERNRWTLMRLANIGVQGARSLFERMDEREIENAGN